MEKRRPYTLKQWYALCQQTDHKPPDLTTDRTSRPMPRKRHRWTQQNEASSRRPPSANVMYFLFLFFYNLMIALYLIPF